MALWQYTFYVLPKESVLDITLNIVYSKDEDSFDDSPYWKYARKGPFIFESVNEFLQLEKSWSKDLILYGDIESTCFEIFLEGEFVESVSFRIDFRSNYEAILDKLLFFLMKNDMMILGEDLNVVKLNEYDFKTKIEDSVQYSKYFKIAKATNKKKDNK